MPSANQRSPFLVMVRRDEALGRERRHHVALRVLSSARRYCVLGRRLFTSPLILAVLLTGCELQQSVGKRLMSGPPAIPPCLPSTGTPDFDARTKWASENPRVALKVVSVVSPASVKVTFDADPSGKPYTVMYRGTRGPSPADSYYQAALEANRRLVEGEAGELEGCSEGVDALEAAVYVRGKLVNRELVTAGHALARLPASATIDGRNVSWVDLLALSCDKYAPMSPYCSQENEAKAKGNGLWESWCADRSRFGADDPMALFKARAAFDGVNPAYFLLLSARRYWERAALAYASAWVIHNLVREADVDMAWELKGRNSGVDTLHDSGLCCTGGKWSPRMESHGWPALSEQAKTKLREMLSKTTPSCGSVFLAAPPNQDITVAVRLAIGGTETAMASPTPTGPQPRATTILASGLQYTDLTLGTGPTPAPGQTVSVHYTGWLPDGKKFDSSHDRGQPFQFVLGRGQVIKGWDEGIATMKVGGKRKLVIPPELGYGAQGVSGAVPPNATLTFEVELLAVR